MDNINIDIDKQYSSADGANVTSFSFTKDEWEAIKTQFLEAERESVSGNDGYKIRVEAILTSQIIKRKMLPLNDLALS